MLKFIFEWWGGLRPAWKMQPNGEYFMPLFLGLWVSIPQPESGQTKHVPDGVIVAPHCVHGYNGICPKCGAMQTPPRR